MENVIIGSSWMGSTMKRRNTYTVFFLQLISRYCRIYASVNQVSIGSNNGLSPDQRQAIIWTNARISLIGPLGTKFNEFRIKIQNFSFMKIHSKMSSEKWRPFVQDEMS